jgi:vesicle coat complex subunit
VLIVSVLCVRSLFYASVCVQYVGDIDADISRFAVRSIGRIAIRLSEAAEESIEHLLAFLELRIAHVTSETVVVLKDFLRKYPDRYEDIIPPLTRVLRSIEEPEGKQACIWMASNTTKIGTRT